MSFRKYRNGQPWSEADMQQLALYVKEGRSIKEMASLLYRKTGSILTRLRHPTFLEFCAKMGMPPPAEATTSEEHVVRTSEEELVQEAEYAPLVIRKLVFEEEKEPLLGDTPTSDTKYICVFDTETTGLSPYSSPVTDSNAWSCVRLVQFAYELYTQEGEFVEKKCVIIQPDGFVIPDESVVFHKITTEHATAHGIPIHDFFSMVHSLVDRDVTLVAHNCMFDDNVIQSELYRYRKTELITQWKSLVKECTMMMGKRYFGKVKKLSVLYQECGFHLDGSKELHQADVDTELCASIYFHLRSLSMSNIRFNLVSRYEDKEILKYLGAKWDSGQRVWYIYDAEPFSAYVRKWFV